MVINSTSINKTKENLNSDGHQFHQYQQNKRKFKQWWSSIPPVSTKRTITSHLNWTHWTHKDHDMWRLESRSWVRTDTNMCGVKSVNEHPILLFVSFVFALTTCLPFYFGLRCFHRVFLSSTCLCPKEGKSKHRRYLT